MISTIIFDLGGVFFHKSPERMEALARRHGISLAELRGVTSGPLWTAYKRGRLSEDECWSRIATRLPDSFRGSVRDLRDGFTYAVRVDVELVALARRLADVHRLAALSNAGSHQFRRVAAFGLNDLFEVVALPQGTRLRKPQEAVFITMLLRLRTRPGEVMFVDDKPGNVEAAGRLGILTHLYRGSAGLAAALERQGGGTGGPGPEPQAPLPAAPSAGGPPPLTAPRRRAVPPGALQARGPTSCRRPPDGPDHPSASMRRMRRFAP